MSKELEIIAECNLEFSKFYVEWRCRCESPEARWSGSGVAVRPLHAAHVVARLSAAGHAIVPSVEPEQADDAYGEPHLNYWPGAGHRSQVWVDHWDGKPVVCHGDPMAYKMIAVDKVQSFAAALLAAAASATMKEPENG